MTLLDRTPHLGAAGLVVVVAVGFTLLPAAGDAAHAANRSTDVKKLGQRKDDQALVYFIREDRKVNEQFTLFLYADDSFLGVLENDSYTFAYVDPGTQLLWLNWTKINRDLEVTAGQVYFFDLTFAESEENWRRFESLDEQLALGVIQGLRFYVTPTDKERATAQRHIGTLYAKARDRDEPIKIPEPVDGVTGENDAYTWACFDLEPYSVLHIEDFTMNDTKASERGWRALVETVPWSFADQIAADLADDVFRAVSRDPVFQPAPGALVLRGAITKYVPGPKLKDEEVVRLLADGDASNVDLPFVTRQKFAFELVFLDAATGVELASLSAAQWRVGDRPLFADGRPPSTAQQRTTARDIAQYLRRCKLGE